jgi:hypothetical protein
VRVVTATPVPAGLRVEVQGRVVDVASGAATVFVDPGEVAVRATVEGREAFAQGFAVQRKRCTSPRSSAVDSPDARWSAWRLSLPARPWVPFPRRSSDGVSAWARGVRAA